MPVSDQLIKIAALTQHLKFWRAFSIVAVVFLLFIINYTDIRAISNIFNKEYIARLNITGVISTNNERDKLLKQIINNNKIKALILHIDSPGGTFVGSEVLYSNIRKIAERKPVVAVLNNFSASGGYMAALAADYIIAHHGTLTGSIGVISQYVGINKLAENLGITLKSIKSSNLKEIMSPLEELTPEGESAIKEVIKDSHDYFVNLVTERRNLKKDNVDSITNGKVYTGNQALSLGLVDEIGGEEKAIQWLEKKNIKVKLVKNISEQKKYNTINKLKILLSYIDVLNSSSILSIW